MKLLLRLYPPAWRERYGAELEAMVADAGGVRPRVAADLVLAAARERLRERAVVVLQAWAVFVVAGCAVQKLSEHVRSASPWAFDGLVAGAVAGAAAIVVAAVLALPAVRVRLRAALALTLVAVGATAFVVWWAHGPSRSGWESHAIGIGWVLLLATALASWTSVGVAVARQSTVNRWLVRTVAGAMVEMTVCTAVWWSGSSVGFELVAPVVAMCVAATAGVTAARQGRAS